MTGPVAAAILATQASSPIAGEGQGGGYPHETLAIVAERRLGVAALTALLLRDPAYRLVVEARGSAEVGDALATHQPAVMIEARESPLSSPSSEANRLQVDPDVQPEVFASSVRAAITRARAASSGSRRERLSDRERQILSRIASGRSTKEVARDCAISAKTVGNHVSNICQKLNLHRRAQLVLFALEHGFTAL